MTGFAAILVALGLHGPALPAGQGAMPIPPARVVGYQEQGLACRSCIEATLAALQNQDSRQPVDSAGPSSQARTEALSAHSNSTARLIHPEGMESAGSKSGIRPGVAVGSTGTPGTTTSTHRPANFAGSNPSQLTSSEPSSLSEHAGLPLAVGSISERTADLYFNSCGRSDLQVRRPGKHILNSGNRLRQLCVIWATPARVPAFEEKTLNKSGAQILLRSGLLTAGHESCARGVMNRTIAAAGQGMAHVGDSRSGTTIAAQKTPQVYLQFNIPIVAVPAASGASIRGAGAAWIGDLTFNTMGAVLRAWQSQQLRSSRMDRNHLLSISKRRLISIQWSA